MRVVTTTPVNWQGAIHRPGTELDVPDEVAERWERTGACKRVARSGSRPVQSVRTSEAEPETPVEE